MKICVTSRGKLLDSPVDPRLSRCKNFLIIDSETFVTEVVPNNSSSENGIGVSAEQILSGRGIQTLLTGSVGANAFKNLNDAEIKVVTGVSGTVREVVKKYKSGGYIPAEKTGEEPSFGIMGPSGRIS